MPYPFWSHPCCKPGASDPEPNCPDCGEPGNFEGWFIILDEGMARYQYVYELTPLGRHRPLADRLFKGARCWCSECGGRGILTEDEQRWAICAQCEGTGGFWVISSQEVEEIRNRILEDYPEAAAPRGSLRFLSFPVIRNPETGLMEEREA